MLVVPLDSLLHGFPREMFNLWEHFGQSGRVSGSLVGGHRVRRHPRALESGTKESGGGFGVAVLAKQHLDDLSVLIDGAVDVAPAPRHFDIGLSDRPALSHPVPMCFRGILIERGKLLHLVKDGGGIDLDGALGEPLDHVGIAEPEAQVPAHGQPDDRRWEGMTREGSAGEGGEGTAAVRTTVNLCTPSVTAVLHDVLSLTIRTPRAWFLLRLADHSSAAYPIPARPNKTIS
jgi:hypothetical protein